MKKCMMLDLETLDIKNTAVVVSGAYVCFDREAEEYMESMSSYSTIVFQEQLLQGRTISESAIRWHMEHPTDTFKGKAETPLYTFCTSLMFTIHNLQIDEVWSKGANFDISILENYHPGIWNYKLPRCFRTIQALFPDYNEKNPLAHNALEDARDQAKELWRITQKHLLPQSK